MNLKTTLPLSAANTIVEAALAAAREAGLAPLTVVVLDTGGQLKAMSREDGCGIMWFEVAMAKSWGALGMGVNTRLMRQRFQERPTFQASLAAASDGRFAAVPGGVLIQDADGYTIGSVGISGDASDKDEYCAIVGIKAAGLTPDPAEPVENWNGAGL